MQFGNIVRILKSYTYDKSKQPWKHINYYRVDFYKEGETILGFTAGKPFTYNRFFKKKSDMKRFLTDNGYSIDGLEEYEC